jgi:hypothetical protein
MKSRDLGFLLVGVCVGCVVFAMFAALSLHRPERAPAVAGQEVPRENYTIDFSRRYNLVLSGYKAERTYENVKILGYTGKMVRESSGSLSSGYDQFNRWLAIELPDKRRVYLSSNSISYIEETQPTSLSKEP